MSLLSLNYTDEDSSLGSCSTEDLLKILSTKDVILDDSFSDSDATLDTKNVLTNKLLESQTEAVVRKIASLTVPSSVNIPWAPMHAITVKRKLRKDNTQIQNDLESQGQSSCNRSTSELHQRKIKRQTRSLQRHTKNNSTARTGLPQPMKRHMRGTKTTTLPVNPASRKKHTVTASAINPSSLTQEVGDGCSRPDDETNSKSHSLDFTEDLCSHSQPEVADNKADLLEILSNDSIQSPRAVQVEELTPWEEWLLKKEKLRRQELERTRQKEAQRHHKEAQAAAIQAERQKRAAIKCRDWLESKHRLLAEQQKAAEALRQQELMKEQEIKEAKKLEAERKYALWIEHKKEEAKEAAELQRQKQLAAATSKQLRREAAAEKFTNWMKSAHQRQPNSPVSYGYADGTVISYYDRSANPKPSFVNPNPWISPLEG